VAGTNNNVWMRENAQKNESAPTQLRVLGRSFEQPSPEVCSVSTLTFLWPVWEWHESAVTYHNLVGPAGVEPATLGLEIRCSIRLSYGPKVARNADLRPQYRIGSGQRPGFGLGEPVPAYHHSHLGWNKRVRLGMTEKASVTLSGTVEKIIESRYEPDKIEIIVERADHLFQEVRIENSFTDEKGNEVGLKLGAPVEITMEAAVASTRAISDQETSK
jgi:hypothetical protein